MTPWSESPAWHPLSVPADHADLAEREDVVEDVVALCGRDVGILRPRDSEALIDEHAFEQDEFLPYWADLWPSALALARQVCARSLRGARTLELGCGLGLASIAAALAGGRVVATDWAPASLEFAAANARRNGADVAVERCDWAHPDGIVARAPWRLVLGSDLLYEPRNVGLLVDLLPRLVDERGEVWIADPGRRPADAFLEAMRDGWHRESTRDPELPRVSVHRFRKAVSGPPR